MDYVLKYAEFLKKHSDIKRPLKIVCDSSNGTTSIVLKQLTDIPNIELILINTELDPEFPAHGPNPLMPGATDQLTKKVLEVGAAFGVAFDADGDRAFFVDNNGRLLPSFVVAAIWFKGSRPPFVADEPTYLSLTTSGIFGEQEVIPARVGSIFIKEAIRKNNATLGAEFSGHYYFKDFFGLDSGIFSMIYMANILSRQNRSLAKWHAEYSRQILVNIDIKLKNTTWENVRTAVKTKTASMAKRTFEREGFTLITDHGWINVRPSNTEPLVRIGVGAKTKEQTDSDLAVISKIVQDTDERTA